MRDHPHDYILENTTLSGFTYPDLLRHATSAFDADKMVLLDIQPLSLEVNAGLFANASPLSNFPEVSVTQTDHAIVLSCPCPARKGNMCVHQAQVMHAIMHRPNLRLFFDPTSREVKIKQFALDYGMENEQRLDEYFLLEYVNGFVKVRPKVKEMLAYTESSKNLLQSQLLPKAPASHSGPELIDPQLILVLRPHKYYSDQFHIELYEAQTGSNGKIKAPLQLVDPQSRIWESEHIDAAKFFIAVSKLQQSDGTKNAESNIEVLKVIVQNPLKLEVFFHDARAFKSVSSW